MDTMSGHNVFTQCLDTMSLHNVRTQWLDTMWQCGNVQYSIVQYSTVQYSTVQYSTVTGEVDGMERRWQTPLTATERCKKCDGGKRRRGGKEDQLGFGVLILWIQ